MFFWVFVGSHLLCLKLLFRKFRGFWKDLRNICLVPDCPYEPNPEAFEYRIIGPNISLHFSVPAILYKAFVIFRGPNPRSLAHSKLKSSKPGELQVKSWKPGTSQARILKPCVPPPRRPRSLNPRTLAPCCKEASVPPDHQGRTDGRTDEKSLEKPYFTLCFFIFNLPNPLRSKFNTRYFNTR